MHAVIETRHYLKDADDVGLSENERLDIVGMIAANPLLGDIMPGTGGARKIRVAGRGKGKSGGYRVISYYAAADIPVFLLGVLSKGERANLSRAERNELRAELSHIASDYRASVRSKVTGLRRRQP
jgi:hypothetical protein